MTLPPEVLDWFNRDQELPPSFMGNNFIYALSVTGLMIVFLLSAEWLWRTAWAFREKPKELKHPITISRCIMFCLLGGILMRVTGDVVLTTAWPELTPYQRLAVAQTDRLMDGLSAFPMAMAWMWGVLGGAMIDWQLARVPIPINLWPSWRTMARPLGIGFLVIFIAFSVTYLR